MNLSAITAILAIATAAGIADDTCGYAPPLSPPLFPPRVGTKKLFEDTRQIVWVVIYLNRTILTIYVCQDLTLAPGERVPPHEHMHDYLFHVLSASRLAVFSGTTHYTCVHTNNRTTSQRNGRPAHV